MTIKNMIKIWFMIAGLFLLPLIIVHAGSQPPSTIKPKTSTLDLKFPYGSLPTGNVCVSSDYYATPETMLGSWAMIEAVTMDSQENVLPGFMTDANTVYAVGTAAIGDQTM